MQMQEDFKFLEEAAMALGTGSSKVIPADMVAVEDRVRLKCRVGCPSYGNNLKCPPFVPTPDEFRKILKEYRFAMVVKHRPPEMPENPGTSEERLAVLRAKYREYYRTTLSIMLELEKAAFNGGYAFATAFVGGSCHLCEKCNVEKGVCLNPTMARIAAEAVGVNVVKTAENAGMTVEFSAEAKAPEPMALLLID